MCPPQEKVVKKALDLNAERCSALQGRCIEKVARKYKRDDLRSGMLASYTGSFFKIVTTPQVERNQRLKRRLTLQVVIPPKPSQSGDMAIVKV